MKFIRKAQYSMLKLFPNISILILCFSQWLTVCHWLVFIKILYILLLKKSSNRHGSINLWLQLEGVSSKCSWTPQLNDYYNRSCWCRPVMILSCTENCNGICKVLDSLFFYVLLGTLLFHFIPFLSVTIFILCCSCCGLI